MKKSVLKLALILSAAPLLVSCASQKDVEDLRYQLRIVNKKIEDMKSDTVDRLQKRQAAASGQMDVVEQDIMQLKSQLEESYHLNQRLREQNKELGESISSIAQNEAAQREEVVRKIEEQQREKDAQLTQLLNEKIRQQEANVKAIQLARIKEAERRAKEAAITAELAKKRSKSVSNKVASGGSSKIIRSTKKKKKHSIVAPPIVPNTVAPTVVQTGRPAAKQTTPVAKTTSKANASSSRASSSGNEFGEAQKLYNRKKYNKAFGIFEQIAATPSSPQKVDARYMMGEVLFAQKEYDKAIMQYQKIIAQHSRSSKAPAAMLRQAMAFEKLADKDTAKVIYKKVLKKHGGSSEAATAKKRLDNL